VEPAVDTADCERNPLFWRGAFFQLLEPRHRVFVNTDSVHGKKDLQLTQIHSAEKASTATTLNTRSIATHQSLDYPGGSVQSTPSLKDIDSARR
jgi:hypothetical protein